MWFDGSAAPNPGRIGLGILLESPDGTQHPHSLHLPHGCNNAAETHALIHGLTLARHTGITHLQIYSDSDFVVRHVNGLQHTEIMPLKALVEEARGLMAQFESAALVWIPRHRNALADALSRDALGLPPKPASHPGKRPSRRR